MAQQTISVTFPDLANEQNRPTEFNVSLHGETYHIRVTGTGHRTQDNRPFYMTVDGVPEEVLVEILDEIQADNAPATGKPAIKGSKRPRATLPVSREASEAGVRRVFIWAWGVGFWSVGR